MLGVSPHLLRCPDVSVIGPSADAVPGTVSGPEISSRHRECEPLQAPPARQLPSTDEVGRQTSARGMVNIHVTKSPGTLPPSRARPSTRQHYDPCVRLPLPELHNASIILVRVSNNLRTSCFHTTRRYIQASKSPALSSAPHVRRRARDIGIGLGSNSNSNCNLTTCGAEPLPVREQRQR